MDGARGFTRQSSNGRHYATVAGYVQEVPAYWSMMSETEIDAVDNGCGLSWWPAWVRELLNALSTFRPPARVHDVEFAKAVCPLDIAKSNWRFFRNCRRMRVQSLRHVALPLWIPQLLWVTAMGIAFLLAVWIGGMAKKRQLLQQNMQGKG